MLTQSFVFKLLDLKKSSRRFLMFLVICLFGSAKFIYSGEDVSKDRLELLQLSQELVMAAAVLQYLTHGNPDFRDYIVQSPSGLRRSPGFDGPPGNEQNFVVVGCEDVVPSPKKASQPKWKPGPPGNE